jgi:hypothetical protein
MHVPLRKALLAGLLLAQAWPGRAGDVVAVLAKDTAPYFDAYAAFQKALKRPVQPLVLGEGRPVFPKKLKAAAAFGVKAAALDYPGQVAVVYALSPSYWRSDRKGRSVRISLMPAPQSAAAAFKQLLPGLKRLAVLDTVSAPARYFDDFEKEARARGIETRRLRLPSADSLPETLRSLRGSVEVVWLAPAPELINKMSLFMISEFACANRIYFLPPSGGLLEYGSAVYAPDYESMGQAAAAAVLAELAGKPGPDLVYAESRLLVNRDFASRCSMPLDGGAK